LPLLALHHSFYFYFFLVALQMPANDGVSDIIRVEGSPSSVATAKATIEAILKKIADSKVIPHFDFLSLSCRNPRASYNDIASCI
jgi:hypothetical protein